MTAQADQKFFLPGTGPTSGLPSGAKVKGPLMTRLITGKRQQLTPAKADEQGVEFPLRRFGGRYARKPRQGIHGLADRRIAGLQIGDLVEERGVSGPGQEKAEEIVKIGTRLIFRVYNMQLVDC